MKADLNRIKWLFQLQKIIKTQNIPELESGLLEKLDLLVSLHDVLADKTTILADNEKFLESLILKFYLHGITICNISKGYKIQSKYLDDSQLSIHTFLDISSLLTVGRAQMECLLMYQHIYVNEKDEHEQNLRYYSWIYTALIQRRDIPNFDKVGDDKFKQTLDEIEQLKSKIQSCPAFYNLSEKQQKGVIETGSAKLFKTWDRIFRDCRFSKMFQKFYYILSSYAHSEGLAGLQLKHNKYFNTSPGNRSWQFVQLYTSWLMTGILIENIVNRFPSIRQVYDELDPKIKYEIQFLSEIARFEQPTT